KQFVIQNPFKEDTWVSSIEIRPGNASVVHHVLLQVVDQTRPGVFNKIVTNCTDCVQKAVFAQADAAPGVPAAVAQQLAFRASADAAPFNPQGSSYNDAFVKLQERMTGRGAFTTMEAVYAPGTQPIDYRFTDSAKLIPGGVPLRIEVHYTPNGKE